MKKLVRILAAAAAVAASFAGLPALAQATTPDRSAHHASPAAPTTEGEVRKIDKEQGKVTLKHGPIANLDMPGMTMVFKVADPHALDSVKEGDKVRFAADRVDGTLTVTAIEVVK